MSMKSPGNKKAVSRKLTADSSPVIVGVDEAGRGPIAGPVTVAAVALLINQNYGLTKSIVWKRCEGVRDSKQLSEKKREYFRGVVEDLAKEGVLRWAVHSTKSTVIDERGIVYAIQRSLDTVLDELALDPHETRVLLDGALKAPQRFVHQETIIRGDETELPITLAGIMAKTTRDRGMVAYAKQYPQYGFDSHKGYGTPLHYRAIEMHGLCRIHRASFKGLTN